MLVCVIGSHLTWRVDLDRFIAVFDIDCIEKPNLPKTHHMPEIPAH
jgi:hypothetical protein